MSHSDGQVRPSDNIDAPCTSFLVTSGTLMGSAASYLIYADVRLRIPMTLISTFLKVLKLEEQDCTAGVV